MTASIKGTDRLTTGKHLLTILFGLWLLGGVFIDGFAHNHGVVETFFTPWHAILYSGFAASAIWIGWVLYREKQRSGLTWLQSVPTGYGLGAIGVVVFLLGGLADMFWHIIFGIEQSFAALLSPSHLALFVGALLILSSPFRAGWHNPGTKAPSWREFAPPFLSLALSVSAVGFFLMYAWMFRINLPAQQNVDWYWNTYFSRQIAENNELFGLTMILLDTMLLMYPVFMLSQRWILPPGTMTLLFTIVSILMNVLDGFALYPSIIITAAAGLVGDLLYRWLRPGPGRLWPYRIIAIAVPAALWGFYFMVVHFTGGIGWDVEMWTGGIVEAALVSLAVSLIALQPQRASEA